MNDLQSPIGHLRCLVLIGYELARFRIVKPKRQQTPFICLVPRTTHERLGSVHAAKIVKEI